MLTECFFLVSVIFSGRQDALKLAIDFLGKKKKKKGAQILHL